MDMYEKAQIIGLKIFEIFKKIVKMPFEILSDLPGVVKIILLIILLTLAIFIIIYVWKNRHTISSYIP